MTETQTAETLQGTELAKSEGTQLGAKIKHSYANMGKALDNISKALDKNEATKAEETAEYFEAEKGKEYLCIIEGLTEMETADGDGVAKLVPAAYFFAKEKGKTGEPKRYICASTIVAKTFGEILKKYGAFGCAVSLTFLGEVGNGAKKYNDYKIFSVHPDGDK